MNGFPVITSTLSPTHLSLFLREKYDLREQVTCQLIKAGVNHTYLVNDGADKFVFRVYSLNWRTKLEIEEELNWLQLLKQKNISVSYPIRDKSENFIQTLNAPEGERFSVLFSYAKGEKLHNSSEATHFQIGIVMAQLHELANNRSLQRTTYTPQILLVDSLEQLKPFLPETTAEMEFMKSTQTYLLKEFEKIDTDKIRKGIVHLDIWFDNLNISPENEITLFDFDFCGNGWLCLDIAYYVMQLHHLERDEKECQSKLQAFLNGYESITKISAEEKRILPMLGVSLYFFYLGVQCQRFENWSNTFLNETYLKRFVVAIVKRYFDLNKLGE